jgi:hypothetical protein
LYWKLLELLLTCQVAADLRQATATAWVMELARVKGTQKRQVRLWERVLILDAELRLRWEVLEDLAAYEQTRFDTL